MFTVYGSYNMFSPFGGCDNIGIHLEVIAPKTPKGGVNGQLQAKWAEHENRDIVSIKTINLQF